MVSVIIPCYNAEKFITLTLESVLIQSYSNMEVLCLDDGSTDATESSIRKFTDPRISYRYKKNSGVSDTRNQGLVAARGKYVLFLDADDVLSGTFIEKRVQLLEQNSNIDFCCSAVIKIDEEGNEVQGHKWVGACSSILTEVLSYKPSIITCPSNYLFRRDALLKHAVIFDTELSSSADRYFLIELSERAACGMVEGGGCLYYRIHPASMSHHLTLGLLHDNFLFKKKVLQKKNISPALRKEFSFKANYIFAGSYYHLGKYLPFFWYSLKAFSLSPGGFIKQLNK